MIYKSILLTLLLVPFTMADNNPKNMRIKELEETISQKELEITNLGNIIAQKDELLDEQKSDWRNRIELIIYQRVQQLEKQNDGKSLSQEDQNKVEAETRKKAVEFLDTFFDVLNSGKEIKGMLTDSLFQDDETSCGLFKFYYVRLALDMQIIFDLVKKYENCIKERNMLRNELIDLQKQNDMKSK